MPYIEFNRPNMARTQYTMPLFTINKKNGLANWYNTKPLFSDNSLVLQKPRVNYGGGVGTVSNAGKKSRYT